MSIARDGHWQDSYGGITTNALTIGWIARAFGWRSRRWPTLPRSLERSTIGAVGLNDRVRNGNGCGPYALTASNALSICTATRDARVVRSSSWSRREAARHGELNRLTVTGCEQRCSTAEA